MATGCESSPAVSSAPKRAKRSVRHQLQLSFPSDELRDSCRTRMEHAKKLLFSRKSVNNGTLCSVSWIGWKVSLFMEQSSSSSSSSRMRLFLVLQSLILLVSLLHKAK